MRLLEGKISRGRTLRPRGARLRYVALGVVTLAAGMAVRFEPLPRLPRARSSPGCSTPRSTRSSSWPLRVESVSSPSLRVVPPRRDASSSRMGGASTASWKPICPTGHGPEDLFSGSDADAPVSALRGVEQTAVAAGVA